jgi:dinuclear metal center YbgI/SA1388 family protein
MTIADITDAIEAFAPLHLQEDYDNSGLIAGDSGAKCTGVLCTLDATSKIVDEARDRNCNLIIAHHPILFRAVRNIRPTDYVRRTLVNAIKHDIAIYAAHTNLDNVIQGVNGRIADKLGLTHQEVLLPKAPGIGSGLTGRLKNPMSKARFLALVMNAFMPGVIRHNDTGSDTIDTVAVCGGAGSFLIGNALAANADAFITSDLKYHDFFDAEDKMLLCDIGHFESEQFTTDLFVDILLRKFRNFAVLKSEVVTNPVHYFTGK